MCLHVGTLNESSQKLSRKRYNKAGTVLALLLVLASFCRSAGADYFSPAPPLSNIFNQTSVSVALTTPATTVYINVTEYDAQQIVKNITVDFSEPITYVGLVIDVLKDKPLIVNAPNTVPVIQYYDIRFLTGLGDKITNVTIVFSVERATLENENVAEGDLLHYQYDGSKFDSCRLLKVDEDENFLFFETETKMVSCFAITGSAVSRSWWHFPVAIAVTTLLAIVGIYVYRRDRLNRQRNPVRT